MIISIDFFFLQVDDSERTVVNKWRRVDMRVSDEYTHNSDELKKWNEMMVEMNEI